MARTKPLIRKDYLRPTEPPNTKKPPVVIGDATTEGMVRILENLSTTVLTLDADLRLTSLNPAGEMLFAISARKVLGQRITELLPQSERFVHALSDALASRHPFTAHGVRLALPAGRSIMVDCTVSPLPDGTHGDVLLVELTQIDRLLRLAREESLRERQAANRAVLRGLAHEIKNPLGGLRGAAQLLERELSDRTLKEYTQIIIHEADRLRNLVDRMIGSHQPFTRRALNIHEILEHIRKLILVEVPVGLSIETDYDPSLPEVDGDPDQLTQAILNIVRNAVQALAGRGTIWLRTRIERGHTIGAKRHRLVLRAEVEDNGPGVPEELLDRIFYPMVTGRADGMGLGLSIAQEIVQRHGGLIECSSRPQRTVFTILLPLEQNHD